MNKIKISGHNTIISVSILLTLSLLIPKFIYTNQNFILNEKTINKYERKYGSMVRLKLEEWVNIINESKGNELETLKYVNDFFNRMTFIDDIIHWKKVDYWATPAEFIASGAGDCEDFSISKFYTLIKMGIPEDKLTLTYVKSLTLNQAHMVVTYYPSKGGQPLVLDNIDKRILPSIERKDLMPVYSVNGKGLWIAKQQGKGKFVGDGSNLQKWNELISKVESEELGN